MNETELWQNLVDQLRQEHSVRGEAFSEVGHLMIAAMHPVEATYCPCGCSSDLWDRGQH